MRVRGKFVLGVAIVLVAGAALLFLDGLWREREAAQHLAREALVRMSQDVTAIADFYEKHGRMPKDAAEAGFAPRWGGSMFVSEVRYAPGELTAVLKGAGARYEGKTVSYRARPSGQTLAWRCVAGEGFPPEALPASCRER